ncbi:hypothetical protein Skr01_50490 [Sphaerisporangium krabiense]|uniref:Uncharacterized protein n=1 Tax=Sphaerisporangium krabiense TaxID=763782 RepID=A0A7W8Z9R4_9ACTN|nr:hypothetical protein [Sphaerisporangium krabiense]MBB5630018.1 hypothetical protein [Sphaerisporangium krabiense]GII64964.1 hypothetical protein Skr01_50490 [Sphaerisporangium krabiense]
MELTQLLVLAGFGAFHGLNPAMGWLFAVALGLQERSRRAVLGALPPIVLGHAGSVLVTLALVAAVRMATPPRAVSYGVAALVCGFGLWKLLRRRHPRWVGMRVTGWQLAGWSFLMATAHGAGLMLLPVTLAGHERAALALSRETLTAAGVHTAAMLAVTATLAVVVYERLGVSVLRRAWFNLDLAWAVALIGAGVFAALT